MRRAVSLSGAVFALLCLAMVLFVLPASAREGSMRSVATDRGEQITSSAQVQYENDGEVDVEEDVIRETISTKKIPNTGGPPLLVFGALLLGAAAVVGRVVLRP